MNYERSQPVKNHMQRQINTDVQSIPPQPLTPDKLCKRKGKKGKKPKSPIKETCTTPWSEVNLACNATALWAADPETGYQISWANDGASLFLRIHPYFLLESRERMVFFLSFSSNFLFGFFAFFFRFATSHPSHRR
jgi:hypothetical protein